MDVIYRNQHKRYTLFFDASADAYYLSVYCGRLYLHNTCVQLSPEQIAAYRESGPSTVDCLAALVREQENAKEVVVVDEPQPEPRRHLLASLFRRRGHSTDPTLRPGE